MTAQVQWRLHGIKVCTSDRGRARVHPLQRKNRPAADEGIAMHTARESVCRASLPCGLDGHTDARVNEHFHGH